MVGKRKNEARTSCYKSEVEVHRVHDKEWKCPFAARVCNLAVARCHDGRGFAIFVVL